MFGFDHVVVNGVKSKLQPIRDAKFVEDVMQVIFDSLFADGQLSAYLLVTVALRHQMHDLLFTLAQQRLLPLRSAIGAVGEQRLRRSEN